jgi:Zn-dependent protease with chaperone function
MTFFEHQHVARKNTKRLMFYFCLSIIGMNLCAYFAIRGLQSLYFAQPTYGPNVYGPFPLDNYEFHFWDSQIFLVTSLFTTLLIVLGAVYRMIQLRQGGAAVATLFGGKHVDTSTDDSKALIFVELVEKMSIASGCRVPSVYVIPEEPAINAFAAGFSQADSVIVITQGALDKLDKEQLKGILAHEFSHILNSDAQLNMNLMMVIGGLLSVWTFGKILIHPRTRPFKNSKLSFPLYFIGSVFLIIGSLGAMYARLIQTSLCRQREFLADHSASQFTRNPLALAMALDLIQSESLVRFSHPQEDSLRHMLFVCNSRKYSGALSTHPSVEERIKRLAPSWPKEILEGARRHRDWECVDRYWPIASSLGRVAWLPHPKATRVT